MYLKLSVTPAPATTLLGNRSKQMSLTSPDKSAILSRHIMNVQNNVTSTVEKRRFIRNNRTTQEIAMTLLYFDEKQMKFAHCSKDFRHVILQKSLFLLKCKMHHLLRNENEA